MAHVLKNMFKINAGGIGSNMTQEEFHTAKRAANILEFKQGLPTDNAEQVLSRELAYLAKIPDIKSERMANYATEQVRMKRKNEAQKTILANEAVEQAEENKRQEELFAQNLQQ